MVGLLKFTYPYLMSVFAIILTLLYYVDNINIYAEIIGMEGKNMKKIFRIFPIVALLAGVFGVASMKTDSIRAEAAIPATAGYADGIDQSRTRIWLDRGHYNTGDATVVLEIVTGSKYTPSGYVQALNSGIWYAYYDVLVSEITAKDFKFHKYQSADPNALWNSTTTLNYTTGDSAYLFKVPATDDGQPTDDTLTKGSVVGRIKNTFLAKVLEGYLTCSTSLDNGYEAFANMKSNFIPLTGEFWDMEGNLSGINITDYAGTGASQYSSPRGTGVSVDAQLKYDALRTYYNLAHPGSPISRNTSVEPSTNIALITLIGILGMSALAGFYFLKSKKQ